MSTRVPLTADVGRTRRMTRLSHQPVDHAAPSRFACMLHDGMRKIAIHNERRSPARTPAYWHSHLPVFYPFSTSKHSPHRLQGVWVHSTVAVRRNLQFFCEFCSFSACQFTGEQCQSKTHKRAGTTVLSSLLNKFTCPKHICVHSVQTASHSSALSLEQSPDTSTTLAPIETSTMQRHD